MPSNDPMLGEEKDVDIIYSILNGSPYKVRSEDEKLAILKKGRPVCNLNILKREINRNSNKSFQSSWYNIHKWLCGSKSCNKLFCWPCLLMRPETSSWCSIGNDDMKRFTSLATKHARCKSHLKAICEYDETLASFGLSPEFANDLKLECKEEECSLSDKTEAEEDLDTIYFQNVERKNNVADSKCSYKIKPSEANDTGKISNKITFKTWQAIYKDNFSVSKGSFYEDYQLYKWKRKIAKQELKNARLTGEKLKFEIEVLRAKVDYYNALKQDALTADGHSLTTTASSVSESLQQLRKNDSGKIIREYKLQRIREQFEKKMK